jgi:hypothetical protein
MKKMGCASCGGAKKKMALGGSAKKLVKKSTGGMYGIPQENMGTSSQYGFAKKGGSTSLAVCKNGMVRMPDGSCGKRTAPIFKSGGATKAFKKLAPPYDKATFADKIAGAKKRTGKK